MRSDEPVYVERSWADDGWLSVEVYIPSIEGSKFSAVRASPANRVNRLLQTPVLKFGFVFVLFPCNPPLFIRTIPLFGFEYAFVPGEREDRFPWFVLFSSEPSAARSELDTNKTLLL